MADGRKGFLSAGHTPTLLAALLYFDVSFMTWVLLGPLAPFLRDDLGLSATQQGLVTAIPLLGGSLFRPVLGTLGDRIGGRRAALIGMVLTIVALLVGWRFASTVEHLYAIGSSARDRRRQLRGGAAARQPLVSAAVSGPGDGDCRRRQLGHASGDAVRAASRRAPGLGTRRWAWRRCPILLVFVVFALMARDSPAPRTAHVACGLRRRAARVGHHVAVVPLQPDVRRVRRPGQLPHHVLPRAVPACRAWWRATSRRWSSWPAASCARSAAGCRIASAATACSSACWRRRASASASSPRCPPWAWPSAVLGVGMGLLGMGNGAVFQLVPQRFPDRIGLVTGVVGAAGGLGGFFLPTLLGSIKDLTGQYTLGLIGVAALFGLGHPGAAGAGRLLVLAVGAGGRGTDRRLLVSRSARALRRTNRGMTLEPRELRSP